MDKVSHKGLIPSQFHELAVKLLDAVNEILRDRFLQHWNLWRGDSWEDTEANGKILINSDIGKELLETKLGQENHKTIMRGEVSNWNLEIVTFVLRRMILKNSQLGNKSDCDLSIRRSVWGLEQMSCLSKMLQNCLQNQLVIKKYLAFVTSFKVYLVALDIKESEMIKVVTDFLKHVMSAENLGKVKKYYSLGSKDLEDGKFSEANLKFSKALNVSPSELHKDLYLQILEYKTIALLNLYTSDYVKSRDTPEVRLILESALKVIDVDPANFLAKRFIYGYTNEKDQPYHALRYHLSIESSIISLPTYAIILNTISDLIERMVGDPTSCNLMREGYQGYLYDTNRYNMAQMNEQQGRKMLMYFMRKSLEKYEQAAKWNLPVARFACATTAIMLHFQSRLHIVDCESEHFFDRLGLLGVTLENAVQYLKEIAEETMKPHFLGDDTSADNFRIGYAQYIMGLLYATGQLLGSVDNLKAEKWYKKAAIKHNIGNAALNLGLMYSWGVKGVKKNPALAKLYLMQAYTGNVPMAAEALVDLHMNSYLDQEFVQIYMDKCKTLNPNVVLVAFHNWFGNRIETEKYYDWSKFMTFWDKKIRTEVEQPLNLTQKGLTWLERVKRAEILGFHCPISDYFESIECNFKLMTSFLTPEDINLVAKSETDFGKKIQQIQKAFFQVYEILTKHITLTRKHAMEICNTLYFCFKSSPSIKHGLQLCSYYDQSSRANIHQAMALLRSEKEVVRMKASLLEIIFKSEYHTHTHNQHIQSFLNLRFLTENVNNVVSRLYQSEFCLLFRSNYIGIPVERELLLKNVERIENPALVYFLAHASAQFYFSEHEKYMDLPVKNQSTEKIMELVKHAKNSINVYHEVLNTVSLESPLYPGAAYGMAFLYMDCLQLAKLNENITNQVCESLQLKKSAGDGNLHELYREDILNAYLKGIESEKEQLSCFPMGAGGKHLKEQVEFYIRRYLIHMTDVEAQVGIHFDNNEEKRWSYLFTRLYLLCPRRIFTIVGLRHRLQEQRMRAPSKISRVSIITYRKQSWNDCMGATLSHRVSINWLYRDCKYGTNFFPTPNSILYVGHLKLTVVDDVYFTTPRTFVMTEDSFGTLVPVVIENGMEVKRESEDLKLEFGTKLVIINPLYHLLNKINENCVLIGYENAMHTQIILTGKIKDMCRFCGNQDSTRECGKCGRKYCNDMCMKKDAKFLKHEYICDYQVSA